MSFHRSRPGKVTMNLNISLWGAVTWFCYFVIVTFFLRFAASKWPDSPVSKAIMFLNG